MGKPPQIYHKISIVGEVGAYRVGRLCGKIGELLVWVNETGVDVKIIFPEPLDKYSGEIGNSKEFELDLTENVRGLLFLGSQIDNVHRRAFIHYEISDGQNRKAEMYSEPEVIIDE